MRRVHRVCRAGKVRAVSAATPYTAADAVLSLVSEMTATDMAVLADVPFTPETLGAWDICAAHDHAFEAAQAAMATTEDKALELGLPEFRAVSAALHVAVASAAMMVGDVVDLATRKVLLRGWCTLSRVRNERDSDNAR